MLHVDKRDVLHALGRMCGCLARIHGAGVAFQIYDT